MDSPYTLLCSLTNNNPTIAYVALLDPTGIIAKHTPNQQAQLPTHLIDIQIHLHAISQPNRAAQLAQLLSPHDPIAHQITSHPALLVLLLCARFHPPQPFNFFSIPSSSPQTPLEHPTSSFFRTPSFQPNLPPLPKLEPVDTIAEYARFHHRQAALQTQSASVPSLPNSRAFPDASFLTWLLSRHRHHQHHSSFPLVPTSPKQTALPSKFLSPSRDEQLARYILSILLLGPVSSYPQHTPIQLTQAESPTPQTPLPVHLLRRQTIQTSPETLSALNLRLTPLSIPPPPRALPRPSLQTLKSQTLQATAHSALYQATLTFSNAYIHMPSRPVLRAIAAFTAHNLQSYVAALDSASTAPGPFAASQVLHVAHLHHPLLAHLHVAHLAVEQTTGEDIPVINALVAHLEHFSNTALSARLLDAALRPLLRRLLRLLLSPASSLDAKKEELPESLFPPTATAFITRAAETRALLLKVLPSLSVLHLPLPSEVIQPKCAQVLCKELESFANQVEQARFRPEVSDQPCLPDVSTTPLVLADSAISDVPSRPCFSLPPPFRNPPLSDDKHYQQREQLRIFRIPQRHQQNNAKALLVHLSPIRPPLRPPPQILYGQVLLAPLRRIDAVLQHHALDHFKQQLDIFGHLRTLRAHVLLAAGDFADILVEQIDLAATLSDMNERYIQRRANAAMTFYGTSGPGMRSSRDATHLNRCLASALLLSGNDGAPHVYRLSLDAVGLRDGRRASLWDFSMEFKYEVCYPLDIMLSNDVLLVYSKIFDLFIRVLRAKKSLRSLFMLSRRTSVLKQPAQRRALSNCHLRAMLWQFCWEAEHFVSIFGGFEMDQVLGSAWNMFENSWTTVESIWDLRDVHVHYLQDCIRRCLLGEKHKSVLGVMSGGFEIVVKVDKQIASACLSDSFLAHTATRDTIDLLVSATASLRRRSAFLVDVLERLLDGGAHSHLEELLTRLNFGIVDIK